MSKMDDLRAMREARYQASQSRAPRAAAPKTSSQAPSAPKKPEVVPELAPDGLCGHRAISGRTCTREHGHAAKSHRYA